MRNILGIILLLGVSGGNLCAQQVRTYQVDTTIGGGHLRFEMKTIELSKSPNGFSNIMEELYNSQQEAIKPFTNYHQEIERRRKLEAIELKKRIDTLRIHTYNENIGLTEAEADKFWPLYNDYTEKLNSIFEKRNSAIRTINNPYIKISTKESEKLVDSYISSFGEESELMAQYKVKFKVILGAEKLMLLYRVEYMFKIYLLRTL